MSLPQSYRKITFADIALDDVARVDTFESLVDFVANYPSPDQKGLYIYGDMGVEMCIRDRIEGDLDRSVLIYF